MERREELLYWIWMAEALGAGSRAGIVLLRKFGTIRKIYKQEPEATADWSFLNQKEKAAVGTMLRHKSLNDADRILERCDELGIRVVHYEEAEYPESLRGIPNAPLLLYYKGNLPLIDKRFTTAVVGTRTMSDYGRKMAYSMGYGLAAGGALVVSGMALGVDSVAMMGALDAGGITVAVLGGGVDIIYPKEHAQVYRRILETGGCILSEYAPGTEPKGAHFPVRNRIISGLSDAGVVVEGNAKSGSLITARYLIYQGRKLFAVPGQVGLPGSEGPNNLIRDGALPAVTAEDILCEFTYMFPDSVRVDANIKHTGNWIWMFRPRKPWQSPGWEPETAGIMSAKVHTAGGIGIFRKCRPCLLNLRKGFQGYRNGFMRKPQRPFRKPVHLPDRMRQKPKQHRYRKNRFWNGCAKICRSSSRQKKTAKPKHRNRIQERKILR